MPYTLLFLPIFSIPSVISSALTISLNVKFKKTHWITVKTKLKLNNKYNKKAFRRVPEGLSGCRGRGRTSKGQLAITQSSVVDPGRLLLDGSMLRLSRDPHLRDKEARFPNFHHPTVLRSFIWWSFSKYLQCFPSFDISKLRYWCICCK